MSRQEAAARTRERLIDAGLRLAERTSLGDLSANLIVAEAGVSKGTFFHHFGDRAGYLLALHRGFHERLLADLRAATEGLEPGRERLLAIAGGYCDACLRHRGVRALLLEARAEPAIADEVLARNRANAEFLQEDFSALGWSRPFHVARLWVALVVEAALVEHQAGTRVPAVREALAEFVSR